MTEVEEMGCGASGKGGSEKSQTVRNTAAGKNWPGRSWFISTFRSDLANPARLLGTYLFYTPTLRAGSVCCVEMVSFLVTLSTTLQKQ